MTDFDPTAIPVADLVGDALVCVAPEATLQSVAATLHDQGIGAVGVGTAEDLVGVISERDVVAAVAAGIATDTSAGDLAHRELVWADPEATAGEVANEMMEHWIRHMLVGRPGAVVGMISARDLLGVFAADTDLG